MTDRVLDRTWAYAQSSSTAHLFELREVIGRHGRLVKRQRVACDRGYVIGRPVGDDEEPKRRCAACMRHLRQSEWLDAHRRRVAPREEVPETAPVDVDPSDDLIAKVRDLVDSYWAGETPSHRLAMELRDVLSHQPTDGR